MQNNPHSVRNEKSKNDYFRSDYSFHDRPRICATPSVRNKRQNLVFIFSYFDSTSIIIYSPPIIQSKREKTFSFGKHDGESGDAGWNLFLVFIKVCFAKINPIQCQYTNEY